MTPYSTSSLNTNYRHIEAGIASYNEGWFGTVYVYCSETKEQLKWIPSGVPFATRKEAFRWCRKEVKAQALAHGYLPQPTP